MTETLGTDTVKLIRRLNVKLPTETHRLVKLAAFTAGISIQCWTVEAITTKLNGSRGRA